MRDDTQQSDHTPWSHRTRAVPKRTYSGKVVYDRPTHYFKLTDGIRVFRKAAEAHPPETLPEFFKVISLLPFIFTVVFDGALGFFGIRPILASSLDAVQSFLFHILDSLSQFSWPEGQRQAALFIQQIAEHFGIEVKITLPK